MRYKEVIKEFYKPGTKKITEAIIVPEVSQALKDWIEAIKDLNGVLIGGLALSFYARPRYTADIDVIFLSESDIPEKVTGFKKIKGHSFEHLKTGVEVEVLSPTFLNIPRELVEKVFKTSILQNGIRLASAAGLVALKIMRGSFKDLGDIESIMENHPIDLTDWPIPAEKLQKVEDKMEVKLTS